MLFVQCQTVGVRGKRRADRLLWVTVTQGNSKVKLPKNHYCIFANWGNLYTRKLGSFHCLYVISVPSIIIMVITVCLIAGLQLPCGNGCQVGNV